jgi:hypothetical protein
MENGFKVLAKVVRYAVNMRRVNLTQIKIIPGEVKNSMPVVVVYCTVIR